MKKLFIATLLTVCLVACTSEEEGKGEGDGNTQPLNVSTKEIQNESMTNTPIAKKAKEKILKYEEVNEVIALHLDKQLFVGFNVNKFQEFNVGKIEKRVKKDLNKTFPDKEITVSHDRKILIELGKLKNEENSLSNSKIEERLQKVKKLAAEKT